MPELPDIAAYIAALEPRIIGQPLEHIRLASAFLLRTAQPPIADVEGHTVRELRRIGKRIAFGLDNNLWLVLHLMIAGRLHWKSPGAKLAGRNNLAALDFPNGSLVLTGRILAMPLYLRGFSWISPIQTPNGTGHY
jgi:formamidopyrimidine-DNA glycosylase